MKKFLSLFFLILPKACWASGDVGVLIWSGALLAYYLVAGVVLMFISGKRRISIWLLVSYAMASLALWWIYMATTMNWMAPQLTGMLLVPLIFITIAVSQKQRRGDKEH